MRGHRRAPRPTPPRWLESERSAAGTLAQRRDLDAGAAVARRRPARDASFDAAPGPPLRLADFEPRSMLHVPAHQVPRARFPVIDFHQHVNDGWTTEWQAARYPPDRCWR